MKIIKEMQCCYICGEIMLRQPYIEVIEYQGLMAEYQAFAWLCQNPTCDERMVNGADLAEACRQMTDLKDRAQTIQDPAGS